MSEVLEAVPTINEQVNKLLDGRSQTWLVDKFKELGKEKDNDYYREYTDVRLSRKMNNKIEWTIADIQGLAIIFNTKIKV